LYTSPDLRCIRERIQINNKPIGEDLFTRYFFEVWERLTIPSSSAVSIPEAVREKGPRFLQFLAIVAFHAFINENVDAAIFETHHGGEYDATNFVQKPVVTGITSLGMDHVAQLGPTVEDIAWYKAGIFKTGAPAFSVPQKEAGSASEEVMRRRAAERGTTLEFVPVNKTQLPNNDRVLSVPVQKINCSLALELARAFVKIKTPENPITADDITQGVTNFSWPGRFEIISDGDSQWFLDGAHNTLSLKQAAEWFSKNVNTTTDMSAARKYVILSHRGLLLHDYYMINQSHIQIPYPHFQPLF
jgi:folylpolyglutamate synthase